MKYDSYAEGRSRRELLDKLKEQLEPYSGRPHLYELLAIHGIRMPAPVYEWMYSTGMGNYSLTKAKPEEVRAIKHLVREGTIVPTLAEDFDFGSKTIRRMKHFDDVHFALDKNAAPIIFEYSHFPEGSDSIIRPDQTHDAAIKQLRARIKLDRAEIDGAPILLRNGPVVWPIHTDREVSALRDRQRSFNQQVGLSM